MIGMRERVLALGGTMTVASTHHGVTVEALVPCGIRQIHAAVSRFERAPPDN